MFQQMWPKYNPKSEKVGTVWKTQIKKESSDFYIYFDLYFIADNMNTKYFMFCLVNFMSFVNIHPFLSFRPATHSKKITTVAHIRASFGLFGWLTCGNAKVYLRPKSGKQDLTAQMPLFHMVCGPEQGVGSGPELK